MPEPKRVRQDSEPAEVNGHKWLLEIVETGNDDRRPFCREWVLVPTAETKAKREEIATASLPRRFAAAQTATQIADKENMSLTEIRGFLVECGLQDGRAFGIAQNLRRDGRTATLSQVKESATVAIPAAARQGRLND